MTERVFEIRTEPKRVRVGSTLLLFEPEVYGAEFVAEYTKLQQAQAEFGARAKGAKATSSKPGKAPEIDADSLVKVTGAMRDFIGRFLVPESRETFAELRIPDRIYPEIIEYLAELYGGGSGNPDAGGGTSTD